MNFLLDRFPGSVTVQGQDVPIDADFRAAIRVLLLFDDPQLADAEKRMEACRLLYGDAVQPAEEAYSQLCWFLNCGKDAGRGHGGGGAPYSWEHDAQYIYTAIQQTYGKDLDAINFLHWWKFMGMFLDLGECFFSRILYYRAQRRTGKLTEDEKRVVAGMLDIIDIPAKLSAEEQAEIDEFERLLGRDGP